MRKADSPILSQLASLCRGERTSTVTPVAGIALCDALFEPAIHRLDLSNQPASHRDGPDLLNVLQMIDLPVTVALSLLPTHAAIAPAAAANFTLSGAVEGPGYLRSLNVADDTDEFLVIGRETAL